MFPGVVSLLQEVRGARGRVSDTSLSRPFQSKNAQPRKRHSSQKTLYHLKWEESASYLPESSTLPGEVLSTSALPGKSPAFLGVGILNTSGGSQHYQGEAFNTSRSVQFLFRLDFNLFCKSTYDLRGLLLEGFHSKQCHCFPATQHVSHEVSFCF